MKVAPSELQIVLAILRETIPGEEVLAFGSRVFGNAKMTSDLDIVFKSPIDKTQQLKAAFDDSDLPFRVDVLYWEKIPESFHKNILKHCEVLQAKS
ncbi:MAG: hypothetical protein A2Y14_04470 [Verrucomicrobia bacterium GWF2_51_19]|nr:MAG: hypothetical protein A2Y14_04470 [Verrucomicrobia bacterium GWF2_51_19]HCJ12502.1 hypothetical protein [Opitutae bacterium]